MANTTLLYLKVSEGKDLPIKDLIGSSDPFCVVRIDNEEVARTPTVRRNLNPFWGEEYALRLPGTFHNVSVYVYDEDALGQNDPIGKVSLNKKELVSGTKGVEKWMKLVPIKKEMEVQGEVDVKVTLDKTKEPVSMQIFVRAARNLAAKDASGTSDPFLEISFADKKISTSTKKKTLFPRWNEQFMFPIAKPIDPSQKIQFTLWDWDRLSKNDFMGQFEISLVDVMFRPFHRAWHKLEPRDLPTNGKLTDSDLGSMRLTVRYTETKILSHSSYEPLQELLLTTVDETLWEEPSKDGGPSVFDILEYAAGTNLTSMANELVKFYLGESKIIPYLECVCQRDIDACDHPPTLFRGNSLATKSLDQFMKVVGMPFLGKVLMQPITSIFKERKACALNPSRVEESVEGRVRDYVSSIMQAILQSANDCPRNLRVIFKQLYTNVVAKFSAVNEKVGYLAISSFLFLRFFVAAVLSPKLFGLATIHPDEKTARALTLVAKVLQKIGNFLPKMPAKESYMATFESLIAENIPKFQAFLDELISLDDVAGTIHMPKRVLVSPTSPILCGFLNKRKAESIGGFGPVTFRRRFFCLSQVALSYGKTERDQRRKSVDVRSICAAERLDDFALKHKHTIQVIERNPSGGLRTVYIKMKDVNELSEWLSAIRKVCLSNRQMLDVYHPGVYRWGQWSCCQEVVKGVRGCCQIHSAVLSDWRDPLDPEAELESIYSQINFSLESIKQKFSQTGKVSDSVQKIIAVTEELQEEHKRVPTQKSFTAFNNVE